MKIIRVFLILLTLSGCNQYVLVKENETRVKGFEIQPAGAWNLAPPVMTPRGMKSMWTADGPILNTIFFFSEVETGKPLITEKLKDSSYPVFDNTMLPNEIAELVEGTMVKLYQGSITESGELAPEKIGGDQGFKFTFRLVGQDDVPRKVYATGAVKNDKLYLLIYQAAELYYFDKDLPNIERMVRNLTLI